MPGARRVGRQLDAVSEEPTKLDATRPREGCRCRATDERPKAASKEVRRQPIFRQKRGHSDSASVTSEWLGLPRLRRSLATLSQNGTPLAVLGVSVRMKTSAASPAREPDVRRSPAHLEANGTAPRLEDRTRSRRAVVRRAGVVASEEKEPQTWGMASTAIVPFGCWPGQIAEAAPPTQNYKRKKARSFWLRA